MSIHIILPRATIFDENDNLYADVADMLTSFHDKKYDFFLMSHNQNNHKEFQEKIKVATGLDVKIVTRTDVRTVFKKEENTPLLKTTIIIGSSDEDLHLAANFKLLLINPGWSDKQDSKPQKYALTIDNPQKIIQTLDIIRNQQKWFFSLNIDEKTELYALTSANNNSASLEEGVIIDGFRSFLKRGKRNYYEALFFHFISGVMKNDDLRNIDIWSIMPSSGQLLNPDMIELKERCRYLTNRRYSEPLFIRHTSVRKSHETSHVNRLQVGASKHLSSIHINPYYRSKLKGKTVCILDDYVTNGCSFEALRNLLLKAGVANIIFVAIGRFKRGSAGIYQKENYSITGDVFSPNYTYELISKDENWGRNPHYEFESQIEVENIYNILNSY